MEIRRGILKILIHWICETFESAEKIQEQRLLEDHLTGVLGWGDDCRLRSGAEF